MALGAREAEVARMIVGQALWLAAGRVVLGLARQNGNQPIRLGERIRMQDQRVDDGKQRRVRTDAKRQSKHGWKRERWISEQRTNDNLNTRHAILL
jgi:hypothetical protein